ncbi:hypothetical protein FNH05_13610 [Amycolatopsis rhizosphaerae]|uniref:Uncharacterized protein n=1 Tax=Amycolatopsis rhizosphaerae TaxID=2053003 RepID=A0A558CTH2_9PSEU|nr:hypothetical protein [Amycolatopsis rhizosphaerae]TVT52060.1 hypothetical protein FNH05_13610 [Amycolatopsis rhizosphaerae]
MQAEEPRYVVEPGTDGSWLVIDRGSDLRQRRAIVRENDKQNAVAEAENLSSLELVNGDLPGGGFDVDDLLADLGPAIDAEHNLDHLLRPQP